MSSAIEQSRPLGLAIYEILREAQASEKRECRGAVRYSFFRPVTIQVGSQRHTGFSREVSESGIGMLHNVEIRPGEVEVVIPTQQNYSVRIRTRIIWCTPCGEGWYISGGEFLGIAGIGD